MILRKGKPEGSVGSKKQKPVVMVLEVLYTRLLVIVATRKTGWPRGSRRTKGRSSNLEARDESVPWEDGKENVLAWDHKSSMYWLDRREADVGMTKSRTDVSLSFPPYLSSLYAHTHPHSQIRKAHPFAAGLGFSSTTRACLRSSLQPPPSALRPRARHRCRSLCRAFRSLFAPRAPTWPWTCLLSDPPSP